MTKKVFEQIAEGLNEALGVARGEIEPFRLHVPAEIDVKAIRSKIGLSQQDFASTFGFGLDQLKQWEQGRSRPVQGMRIYLLLINADPLGIIDQVQKLNASLCADPKARPVSTPRPLSQPRRSGRLNVVDPLPVPKVVPMAAKCLT